MNGTLTTLFAGVLLILLTGCESKPSETDASRALQDSVASQSGGRIRVLSVRKTNGREITTSFGNAYELEYQAELEFTEDCAWSPGWPLAGAYATVPASVKTDLDRLKDPKSRAKMPSHEYWRLFRLSTEYDQPLEVAHKGQRFGRSGKLLFIKTEKGWRAEPNAG